MARNVYTLTKKKMVYLPWEVDLPEEDKTWFEFRKMVEGDYQEFSDLTSTVKLGSKKKGNKEEERAEMNMKLGKTRMFLLTTLGLRWNLIGEDGKDLAFCENNIKRLDPEVVKIWIDAIYDFNPPLKNDDGEDEGDKVITNDGELLPKE